MNLLLSIIHADNAYLLAGTAGREIIITVVLSSDEGTLETAYADLPSLALSTSDQIRVRGEYEEANPCSTISTMRMNW